MKHCTCEFHVSSGICVCLSVCLCLSLCLYTSKECTFWYFSKNPLPLVITCHSLKVLCCCSRTSGGLLVSWTHEARRRSQKRGRKGPGGLISPLFLFHSPPFARLVSSQLCVECQSYHGHSSHSLLYLYAAETRPHLTPLQQENRGGGRGVLESDSFPLSLSLPKLYSKNVRPPSTVNFVFVFFPVEVTKSTRLIPQRHGMT